jgi:crossover junction endodeoxyribonuclease RuvC
MAIFTPQDLTLGAVAVVRILGIDPGTLVAGFGCLEMVVEGPKRSHGEVPLALQVGNVVRLGSGSGDVRLVEMGVMRLGSRDAPLPERLLALSQQLRSLLDRLQPNEVALEEAFCGKSVPAALRIGEARGVVLAESARGGLPVHQFAPARVKRCVTGRGAASKESVANMVAQLVHGVRHAFTSDMAVDATDALAVALTCLEQRRSPLLELGSGG